jgi:hypothetical protein
MQTKGLQFSPSPLTHLKHQKRGSTLGRWPSKWNYHFRSGGATRELADDYHYKGFPTTILLDGEGKIARTFFGYHEMEKLETCVKPLLGSEMNE